MKTTRLGGLAMLGLLLGCATTSSSPQAPAATAQGEQKKEQVADASKDDNALVCEDIPVTGSHIPRRRCRTQRQARQEREAAQKALQTPERNNRRTE
ncbi:hypothetical protein [Hyalangium gracile]|uniref:hypothetical protein n=1 Tax=Hyalangium gracile TaxID=394092 RepID=UPI001CCA4D45|nr:hypothetical protein [Hyalangium gracile]